MKVSERFSARKVEAAQWLLALQDEAILAQIEGLIATSFAKTLGHEPTSQDHLDSIARGEADIAAGRVTTWPALKKKMSQYGVV